MQCGERRHGPLVVAWWAARSSSAAGRVALLTVEELDDAGTLWWLHRHGQSPRPLRRADICLDEHAATLSVADDPELWDVRGCVEKLSQELDRLVQDVSVGYRTLPD